MPEATDPFLDSVPSEQPPAGPPTVLTLPEPPREPPRRSRVVVVEQVYHQVQDGQPTTRTSRYSCPLKSEEQPYVRWLSVGDDRLVALDRDWLRAKPCSVLSLQNEETRFHGKPTEDQKAEADAKVIEVYVQPPGPPPDAGMWDPPDQDPVPFAEVPPGESLRLRPLTQARYLIRCRKGRSTVCWTFLPA